MHLFSLCGKKEDFMKKIILGTACFIIGLLTTSAAAAGQITLRWNPNQDSVDGYRAFSRKQNQAYDYTDYRWQGPDPTCTIFDLEEGERYCFVVRAFRYPGKESGNSNEVCYLIDETISGNTAPVADAGGDIIVEEGEFVMLDGSGSTDPDDGIAYYEWSPDNDYGFVLSDPMLMYPSFTAPSDIDQDETYTFSLTVTDYSGSVDTDIVNVMVVKASEALLRNNWRVTYVSSEETEEFDGAAENLIDGDSDTIWHSTSDPDSVSSSHAIRIDLGDVYELSGFRLLPRQDDVDHGGWNGNFLNYAIYVSMDGKSWGQAIAYGRFERSQEEKEVLFEPVQGRYVHLAASGEVNGNPWASIAEFNMLGKRFVISDTLSRDDWRIIYVDTEETGEYDGAAENVLDGDPDTMWHTPWSPSYLTHPHEIQIDMGKVHDIDGFRALPRGEDIDDGEWNGVIKTYRFYVSMDGVSWGYPVASGVFQKDHLEKEVRFNRVRGRYVRLVALSEINGKALTSLAEFNVIGQ